ncbi:MAG: CvpA family protein [Gemmatimonadota bacterium]|jgi:membrane protein required for colicin V production|nr:hypothetical protein [Gemmatimonadota bacterium]MDP6460856.1 CvpA family protein [Gemmatimonadota bacterium]MDP6529349.1 CvpA family protein [Gemmatimonadota bacterium]MDP6802162.1 CvpA family protein [Gemmatimonadota bacterium]MDP7031492.1 CvpA family protein [Gemmatimonadota bacterium]
MNWVDLVILVILGVSLVAGIIRGVVKTVFSLAGVFAGFVLASRESGAVAMVFENWMPEKAAGVVGFLAVFVVVAAIFALVGAVLRKILEGLSLSWVDRTLGAVFGFLRAALILGLLSLLVEGAGSLGAARESVTYPWALWGGEFLLELVPEETRDRFDWDELMDRVPEGLPALPGADPND